MHNANKVLSEWHRDGSLTMLAIDFMNSFNPIDRSAILRDVRVRCPSISLLIEFLYGQETRLYLGDGHIMSTTKVKPGDLFGPLLFSLVLDPLIHQVSDNCKLLLHARYLDDGTITGYLEEVAKAINIIWEIGP